MGWRIIHPEGCFAALSFCLASTNKTTPCTSRLCFLGGKSHTETKRDNEILQEIRCQPMLPSLYILQQRGCLLPSLILHRRPEAYRNVFLLNQSFPFNDCRRLTGQELSGLSFKEVRNLENQLINLFLSVVCNCISKAGVRCYSKCLAENNRALQRCNASTRRRNTYNTPN